MLERLVAGERLELAELEKQREQVKKMWHTGKKVDLSDGVEFQLNQKPEKNFAKKMRKAIERGEVLIEPRSGIAPIKEFIRLIRFLQNEGGADILSANTDSFTRNLRFAVADEAIKRSEKRGRSFLNGFPIVNYGVRSCRRVIDSVDIPIKAISNGTDLRLIAEISLASGFTCLVSGPVFSTIEFTKDAPLELAIKNFQYVDRLVGYYQEQGTEPAKFNHILGLQTGVFLPSLSHAGVIIDSLLAAEQGVKNLCLSTSPQGNLFQDVASFRNLPKLCKEYLRRMGYTDVSVSLSVFHWGGVMPQDEALAYGIIGYTTVEAILGGANEVAIKTVQEGVGIPDPAKNAASCKATKQIIGLLKSQHLKLESDEIAEEEEMLALETESILDKVIELGKGNLARGVVEAFRRGVMDHPLSPSSCCANNVIFARDVNGAVRILREGNLPFGGEIISFHRRKIAERERREKRRLEYGDMIDGLLAMSRGDLLSGRQSISSVKD